MASTTAVGPGIQYDPNAAKKPKQPTLAAPGSDSFTSGQGMAAPNVAGPLPPAPPGTGGFDPRKVSEPRPYPGGFGQPTQGQAPSQTAFGPTNNLISTQIGPSTSPRLGQAQGLADKAAQGVSNFGFSPFQSIGPANTQESDSLLRNAQAQMGSLQMPTYNPVAGTDLRGAQASLGQASGFATGGNAAQFATPNQAILGQAGPGAVGSFGYEGDTSGVRSSAVGQLNQLLNTTPDRAKLAADSLALLEERSQPGFEQALRSVGQKAAALGRVGSGLTTSELGDVGLQRERMLDQSRRELATNAAQQQLSDQQAKLAAAQGLTSTLGGLDVSAGGLNQGYNQMALGERNAAFNRLSDVGQRAFQNNLNLANSSFGNLSNLAGQQAGFAQIGRNDALTERDAQNQALRDANDVRSAQAGFTRGIANDFYGREADAYNRATGERNAARADEYGQFGANQSRLGALSDYEQRIFGNDLTGRNELRDERGYQYGLSRDANQDRINQYLMEQQGTNDAFDRAMQMAQFGYQTNPAAFTQGAATNAQNQVAANTPDYGALFSEWAKRNQPTSAPAQLNPVDYVNVPRPAVRPPIDRTY